MSGVPDNVVVDGDAGGAGLPAAALPRGADQVILDQIRTPQHEDEQVKVHHSHQLSPEQLLHLLVHSTDTSASPRG